MDDMILDALNKKLIEFKPVSIDGTSHQTIIMCQLLANTKAQRPKWEMELDYWAWRN